MRLTRIEIENFKGIGSRQRIDLRPITLLFGPNSAGKSTILQALHYLREIFERGNVDPDRTIAGGLIDLGGFATLVHNHELDRTVTLKVVLELSDEQGSDGLPLNGGLSIGEPEFTELPVRYLVGESEEYRDYAIVQEVGLEVDIRWSALEQAPYVSRLAIEMDGEPLAAIVSPPAEGRAQLTDFNFAHPLLQRAVLPDDIPEDGDEDFATGSPLEDEIWSLAREAAADRSTPDTPDDQLRIAVGTELGALPQLDRDLILDIRDPDVKKAELEERTPRVNGLRALLSEMVLGPVRLVRDHLMQMTYIGPLREIPSLRCPRRSISSTRFSTFDQRRATISLHWSACLLGLPVVLGRPRRSESTTVITILVPRLRCSPETEPLKLKDCYHPAIVWSSMHGRRYEEVKTSTTASF